jgi:hypothetical protein
MSCRWPPPSWMQRCTRVEKLCINTWSVSSETWRFRLVWLVWVHFSPQSVYCTLYFSNNPTEKSRVLLGPANEEAMAHHRKEKSAAAETKAAALPCLSLPCGLQHHLVETTGYGLVEPWGLEIHRSSLCNIETWLFWLVRLHPQRSIVQCLFWAKLTTKSNFWVINGTLDKFVRICIWPVSKVLLIICEVQMKMCLIAHQKFVRQVWIFNQYFLKMTIKL